LRNFL